MFALWTRQFWAQGVQFSDTGTRLHQNILNCSDHILLGTMANSLSEARLQLSKMVKDDKNLLSELMEDIKFLEKCQKEKKKKARFMQGVSLSDQKKRVDKVLKAGKMLLNIAYKVRKSVVAKEKRIWGDMMWMDDEDKKQADKVYEERRAKKRKVEASEDDAENK